MKEYVADRVASGTEVRVFASKGLYGTYALPMRLDLVRYSPDGFEWGYLGSGPAQLALALLADHLGDDREAIALHHDFKARVVAGLPHQEWTLTAQELEAAVDAARRGEIPY